MTTEAPVASSPPPPARRPLSDIRWADVRARRAATAPADTGSVLGGLWTVVTAVSFFLFSYPLVYGIAFKTLVDAAVVTTAIVAVLSLPFLRFPRIPVSVLLFLGWAASSWLWSLSRSTTLHAVTLAGLIALVAVVIAAHASPGVIIQGVIWGGVAIVVASLLALEEGLPGAANPPGGEGYMAGVGTNRNILAYCLVFALSFALSLTPRGALSLGKWALGTGVLVTGIWLASSGTGLMSAVLVALAAIGVRAWPAFRRRTGVRANRWGLIALVASIAVAVVGYIPIVEFLGRDGTLSGRVPFWEATFEATESSGWIGNGWGAVWPYAWAPAPENPVFVRIVEGSGVWLSHGHNAWVDVFPTVGIVGVLLALGIYAQSLYLAWRVQRSGSVSRDQRLAIRLAILVMVGHAAFGITEPTIAIPLGWFVLVLSLAVLVEAAGGKRLRAAMPSSGRHRARS